MTSLTRAELGALGEQLAVEHLHGLGMKVLSRNWRCRHGELDVVAVDPATRTVVFVEVKTRATDMFGGWASSVTPRKLRRLRRLAGLWLAAHRTGEQTNWSALRIDVVGIRVGAHRAPQLTHIEGVG